jgi:surfactin synthase thioesterase subunit
VNDFENWFPFNKFGEAGKDAVMIFCFHHAGGSAAVYRKWQLQSDYNTVFVPVELPGKGCRMGEKYIYDMTKLSELAAEAVDRFADGRRIVFYGHSMGAAVAFRTAYEMEKRNMNSPEILIVSGRHSPCVHLPDRFNTSMDDDALINELTIMGGTPENVLKNRELMKYLIPHIRNDYKLNESFNYNGEMISVPVYAYAGTLDHDAAFNMLDDWNNVTTAYLKKREFEGNHFFLFNLGSQYVTMLKKRINAALENKAGQSA